MQRLRYLDVWSREFEQADTHPPKTVQTSETILRHRRVPLQVIRFDGGEFVSMAGEFNELRKVGVPIKTFPQLHVLVVSSCLSFSR